MVSAGSGDPCRTSGDVGRVRCNDALRQWPVDRRFLRAAVVAPRWDAYIGQACTRPETRTDAAFAGSDCTDSQEVTACTTYSKSSFFELRLRIAFQPTSVKPASSNKAAKISSTGNSVS